VESISRAPDDDPVFGQEPPHPVEQRWSTFLGNHAKAIVACDFFVAVAATFRLLYVFVVIEHGRRRLVRVDVTAHPSAIWTLQQLWEVVAFDHAHRYLIHDRDSIFAKRLDESIRNLGLTVLKSPPHCPKAHAICERVIGAIRRECLDWPIPQSESPLRSAAACSTAGALSASAPCTRMHAAHPVNRVYQLLPWHVASDVPEERYGRTNTIAHYRAYGFLHRGHSETVTSMMISRNGALPVSHGRRSAKRTRTLPGLRAVMR